MTRLERTAVLRLQRVADADAPEGLDWLSESERRRLESMTAEKRALQFLAGHWLLRRLAAESIGGRARDWSCSDGKHHAPRLHHRLHGEGREVHASLAHSGEWIAGAIAEFPIGVDVESTSQSRDWIALAKATFSPWECTRIEQAPQSERANIFLAFWTIKEAVGKRDGHGLRPELARRQQPHECIPNISDIYSWQLGDCCLAVAGRADMPLRVDGVVDSQQRYWRNEEPEGT